MYFVLEVIVTSINTETYYLMSPNAERQCSATYHCNARRLVSDERIARVVVFSHVKTEDFITTFVIPNAV